MYVGNEKINLKIKNLLSWQKILNNRQIAADIEGKLLNQGLHLVIKQMETMPRSHKQLAT